MISFFCWLGKLTINLSLDGSKGEKLRKTVMEIVRKVSKEGCD
jgi:hypothetical protein